MQNRYQTSFPAATGALSPLSAASRTFLFWTFVIGSGIVRLIWLAARSLAGIFLRWSLAVLWYTVLGLIIATALVVIFSYFLIARADGPISLT